MEAAREPTGAGATIAIPHPSCVAAGCLVIRVFNVTDGFRFLGVVTAVRVAMPPSVAETLG